MKFPIQAERLGDPELAEDPFERIFSFERAQAHPGYQYQPFVQTPSMQPDPTLNFEMGEVIYENQHVREWVKFWKTCLAIGGCITPGFYIFEIYQNDGAPSIDWMTKNWAGPSMTPPKQFQDGCGWGLEGVRYCDDQDYINLIYQVKKSVIRPTHTMVVTCVLAGISMMDLDYVTKMAYNKEKDLVFIYKPNGIWGDYESVHEVHHLE